MEKHKESIGKKIIVGICIVGIVFGLIAFGWLLKSEKRIDDMLSYQQNQEQNLISIGFSQVGAESDWRTVNSISIKQTFSVNRGYNLIFEDAKQIQTNQIRAIRGFIQQDVDYIVFSPVVEDGWDTVLEEAKFAEIPVIVIDRQVKVKNEDLYTAWVGSDFYLQGQKACEVLNQYVQNQHLQEVNIVNIQGTLGSTAQIGRSKALEDAAAHYGWQILAQESGEYTEAKAYEVMSDFLKRYDNINIVYCENDNEAFGAIDAIKDAGKTVGVHGDIQVVSFDATQKGLEYTLNGDILIDAECNPLQGPEVENIIHQLMSKEQPEKKFYMDEQVFTSASGITSIEVDGEKYDVLKMTEDILAERSY